MLDDPAMLRCVTVWLHGWGISVFLKTTVSRLLSVITFAGCPFPHPTLRVLEVHINGITGITINFTESKIHICYSEKHDSTLFFYYFYMPSLLPVAHTIAKGSTFSISSLLMLQNYKQKCLDVSLTCSFPLLMSMDADFHIPFYPYGDRDLT